MCENCKMDKDLPIGERLDRVRMLCGTPLEFIRARKTPMNSMEAMLAVLAEPHNLQMSRMLLDAVVRLGQELLRVNPAAEDEQILHPCIEQVRLIVNAYEDEEGWGDVEDFVILATGILDPTLLEDTETEPGRD